MPLRPRDWFKAQAAAGASRRDYDDLSTKFFLELINDPTFFRMPVEEQLSLFDELDQAKNDLPNDGVVQSFWNATLGSLTKTLPEGAFAGSKLVEGLAERVTGIDIPGPQNLIDAYGGAIYKALGGNEYQPQTVGEKMASYPVRAGAGILKTIPYLAAAGAALPAAPVAAAAGFGGAAAVEGLSEPKKPLADVAEDTAIQSLLGAAFGGVGKLGEVAKWMTPIKETALQAGVGVGGSLLNTQVLNPETPAEDAWIDALMQAGLPLAFHGLGFPTASGARLAREARKEPAAPVASEPTVAVTEAPRPESAVTPPEVKWNRGTEVPGEAVVWMTPDEFIRLANENTPGGAQQTIQSAIENYMNLMRSGEGVDMPTLQRGLGEGRHRAEAAKALGIEQIPVRTIEAERIVPSTMRNKVRVEDERVPPEYGRWFDRGYTAEETEQILASSPTEQAQADASYGGPWFRSVLDRLRQTPPDSKSTLEQHLRELVLDGMITGSLKGMGINELRTMASAADMTLREARLGTQLSPEAHVNNNPKAFRDGASRALFRAIMGHGETPGAVELYGQRMGGVQNVDWSQFPGIQKRLTSNYATEALGLSMREAQAQARDSLARQTNAPLQARRLESGQRTTAERQNRIQADESFAPVFDSVRGAQIGEEVLRGEAKIDPAGGPGGMARQLEWAARKTGVIPAELLPKAHAMLTDAMVRGFWLLGGQKPRDFWTTFGVAPGERFAPETFDALVKQYGPQKAAELFYRDASLTGKGQLRGLFANFGDNAAPGFATRAIGIFGNADASVVRHELGHLFYDMLPPRGRAIYNAAVGLGASAEPSRRDHEVFAELFRHYLETGDAPSPKFEPIFKMFREWGSEVSRPFIQDQELRKALTPEVHGFITDILRGRPGTEATEGRSRDIFDVFGSENPVRPEVKSATTVEPKTEVWETAPVGIEASGAVNKLDIVGRKQTHQLRRNVELGEQGRYESFRTKDGRTWFRVPGGPLAFTEPAAAGRALHQHLAADAQKAPLTMQDVQSTVARYVSLFTASHSRRERAGWDPKLLLDSLESLPRLSIDGQPVDLAGLLKTGELVDVRLDPKSGRWVAALKEHPSKAVQAIGGTAEGVSATMARIADTWLRPLKRVMAGRYGAELLTADDRLTNAFQYHYKPILDTLNNILAGQRKKAWLPGREGGLSTEEARSLVYHVMTETAPTEPKLQKAYEAIRTKLLGPAIEAEAKIEGVDEVVIRARYLHDLIQRLPGRHGKSIIRELRAGEDANPDLMAHAERIAKFVLTERKRVKPTEAEYNELLDSFRAVGINAANISDSQVGIIFQDIAHKLAMHRANEAEGYRFQKAIQTIKLRETDPRRLEELDSYAAMVNGGGLGGGYLYADIPGLPGFHKTTVLGALLGRSLLAQSLQGLAQVAKLPLRDVAAGFGGMLAQIGKAAKGKGKFDPAGVTAGGIVSHAGPRAVLDRIEAYHPFGQLEKTVRVWGEKATTSYARRLGRKAAQGDLLAIREIQQTIGAQQRSLETVIRWATDQIPPGEIMEDTGLPYEVFQFVARGTREVALPYEAQARPSGWTKSEVGKLMTGMQHFSFAQFYYLKDQIWGDLQKAFRALHTEGNTTLAQQYATRAAGRAIKVAIVGPAVGTLINTIWKAATGQWDKSIAKQLADMDDDTKSDARQALELYGRAMLDAGYMGIAADLMNSAYKLAKGERNEYARDSLGFNLAKLQDAVKYLNDLGTQTSRLVQGQRGAATTLGKQTLRFGESMVPALKVVEMPRSWGGQGLTDITDPDVAQDRYRKAISAARQSGNPQETRRLLAGYGRWLTDQSSRTTDPRRRAQYRNALRRLTSRRPRGRLTTEE